MPDREEDERSTEDKGKHIAKGSESEHNWEETGRKISRREDGARAKLDWMNASSYGACERESIVFFFKIFATMCCKPQLQFSAVALPYSRMNKKSPVVCRFCASCGTVAKSLRDQGICGRLSKWCINIVPYGVVGSDSPLKMQTVRGEDFGIMQNFELKHWHTVLAISTPSQTEGARIYAG